MAKIVVLAGFKDSLLNFRGPLLRAMSESGHTVIACAPGKDDVLSARLGAWGVRYEAIPLERTGHNPMSDLGFLWRLVRLLRGWHPDIVLSYTAKPVIYGSIAARLAGVSRIYSIITGLGYAFITENRGLSHRLVSSIVRRLYAAGARANTLLMFQNADDRDLFLSARIVRESRKAALINGSGVDIEHFAPAPLPAQSRSFLLIARLLVSKGIREYAQAARLLKTRYPDASFRLLGWLEPNPDALAEGEIRNWRDEGSIEYLGTAADVRPHIAQASVYVLPSYREGMPRTILEAMAMGRPVVATNVPGCRQAVADGVSGFLVPPRDARSLADAMERFILDPGLISVMGLQGRALAVERYDVRKVTSAILEHMGLGTQWN